MKSKLKMSEFSPAPKLHNENLVAQNTRSKMNLVNTSSLISVSVSNLLFPFCYWF